MRLGNIHQSFRTTWDYNWHPTEFRHLAESSNDLCEASGAHLCMDLQQSPILNEATYKEIASLIDGNFLQQKVRADALDGIQLDGADDDTLRFRINSSEHATNRIQYQCSVKFDEWNEVGGDQTLNFSEQARMLLWVGNIRLHCTCPSFLYHGYQYLLGAIDAAIYQEPRKPVVQNPDERGIVCKHLNRILRVLPFYSGDIAKELRTQFGQRP